MHIHAQSRDEQSQMFRASCDPSTAFSNSFFARLFIRVSLSSDVERTTARPSGLERRIRELPRGRAGLSSDFARPSEAEQPRAAISSAPAAPRLTRAAISSATAAPGRLEQPFRAPLRLRGWLEQPFGAPLRLRAGSSSHLERPCGSERARAAISSDQRLRCGR